MPTRATITLMSPTQGENPNLGTFDFVALPRVGEIMDLNPPELRVQLIEHKPTPASQTTPGQTSERRDPPPAASYIDRILRGSSPGELPIQAPDKLGLIVN